MIESIVLSLSYPLRLMATYIAVGCLKLFGLAVHAERTLITLESCGLAIAVTDACGGIEQLEGLVIIGGVFAFMMQKSALFRVIHWATILPCVVIANAIRLIVTVVLVHAVGEVVMGDTWHIALGWAQTILAVVMLWLFGKAIRACARDEPKNGTAKNRSEKASIRN